MKKLILILALALAVPAFAVDDPPDVNLRIQQKIDYYGGSEYGVQSDKGDWKV